MVDAQCAWVNECQSGWQFGEQGAIEAIVDRIEWAIPSEDRCAVEFGAGDGIGTQLMCYKVLSRPGWKGLFLESDERNFEKLIKHISIPDNIVILHNRVEPTGHNSIDDHLALAQYPANPGLMVVDVDSIDYHIVEGMTARPYVLCVETLDMNSKLHFKKQNEIYVPPVEQCGRVVPDDISETDQANTIAVNALLRDRGYTLVYRSRVNGVYVRNDMIPHLRKVKLNLGCNDQEILGYEGLDIKKGHDVRKLDYPDCSVDEVYASHVLEHIPHNETDRVLKEWVRVLKPGGVLRIAVPDMSKVVENYKTDDPIGGNSYLQAVLFGANSDDNDRHHACFVRESLVEAMNRAGVGFITDFKPFNLYDCSNLKYSLNLEGVKRWFPKIENPKVCLVLNQPRFAFTGHEKCLIQLAQKMKFDVQESCGAFWDRDMTLATMIGISRFDPDILLYSDYDSIFEPEDAQKLIDALASDPQMAAIGAVQMSRHNDKPLVFDAGREYDTPITKVVFQHFGLMAIRREVFDEVPQPWWWSVPGKNDKGEWDWLAWAKSDADITWWRTLEQMGFNVYTHNEVCIGHIVQCVKYPRNSGKGVQLIPIENYWRHGKPKDATFNADLYRPKKEEPNVTNQSNPGG